MQNEQFELDLKGRRCPQALIDSKLAMRKLNLGDVLVVQLDDSSSAQDIFNYAHLRGLSVKTIYHQSESALLTLEISCAQECRFHV